MHHVIVGNGIAGMEAALAVRARDPRATITLVSAEHPHLYARTALMYVLCGQLSLRDTEPYERDHYERHGFERVSRRVVSLDAAARTLRFDDGSTLTADRLLLAIGSRARPAPWPGAGPGVHALVTLSDLAALDAEARPGRHVAVIGGGLIGIEVAEVLHLRGLHVHFFVREPWFGPVMLDAREAEIVATHVRAHGVDMRTKAPVDELLRDAAGRLRAVRLGAEEVPAEIVVNTTGVVPNTAFLQGSGLPLSPQGAIETSPDLSVPGFPGIYAAGDCANVPWPDGQRRPEQLWYTARDQGRVAGAAMAGEAGAYRRKAWYNSAKFFDVEYTSAGWIPPSPATGYRTWFQALPGRAASQRIVCKGERVVGFNLLGSRWNHEVMLRWIQEKRTLPEVLARLPEAAFDEEFSAPVPVGAGVVTEEA